MDEKQTLQATDATIITASAAVFELEKRALTGDRQAVIELVSCFRKLRAASRKLLDARYSDGECDSYGLHEFAMVLEEVEENKMDDDD